MWGLEIMAGSILLSGERAWSVSYSPFNWVAEFLVNSVDREQTRDRQGYLDVLRELAKMARETADA
ncbi:MAG TPA: hypothetical protein VG317_14390 [Pseudonocardiaceae bacterium]|nr:hypothetical protein [Pseudonocardiaceae bacterium]